MNKRIYYIILSILILFSEICIGIFSRGGFVRENLGDILIVIFLYCFLRIFFPYGIKKLSLYVFLFACFTEFMQYFKIADVLGIKNPILRTIIGTTFDMGDIISYFAGFLIIEIFSFIKNKFNKI